MILHTALKWLKQGINQSLIYKDTFVGVSIVSISEKIYHVLIRKYSALIDASHI